ncbi:MAG: hypothetical protein A2Y25_03635 [Candidatus Melainabacteria bacterium GWF2_37_15]|nr:MAG: hypothetical protein A2Y25_03635 [Candidatus Melainabacteria bacterium GWF2_37_15]
MAELGQTSAVGTTEQILNYLPVMKATVEAAKPVKQYITDPETRECVNSVFEKNIEETPLNLMSFGVVKSLADPELKSCFDK